MKIKICGLKSCEDVKYVNIAGVDFAGFIFAEKSKRKINLETAREMRNVLNSEIKSVGVFVNQSFDFISKTLDYIDLIQLHGDENDEYIKNLKSRTGKEIIKAFRADCNLEYYINKTSADYVLIDSAVKNNFGGTGKTFDWNLIPKTDKKIFLAGGLSSQNILNAIGTVEPYCVDINSGVETDGKKDLNKIKVITEIIRGLNT